LKILQSSSKPRLKNSGFVEERTLALPLPVEPNTPPPYDKADVAAFRAFREGRAEPYQQQLVLEWLIYACGTYENPWRSGGDEGARSSDFAAGKQFIGQQIVKMINMPMKNEERGEQG
jgi:hypothetical protein